MNADTRINANSGLSGRVGRRNERLTAWLLGRDARLLPFDSIPEICATRARSTGVLWSTVEQIVGSVGRYDEMTREFFLPLNNALRDRWVKMVELANSEGWPPSNCTRSATPISFATATIVYRPRVALRFPLLKPTSGSILKRSRLAPRIVLTRFSINFGKNLSRKTGVVTAFILRTTFALQLAVATRSYKPRSKSCDKSWS